MSAALGDCYDPEGKRWGIPTFPWRWAPEGMATRRQLRAQGLRPGGQEPAGQVMRQRRHRAPLVGYLYRIDAAKPVRPMTPAKRAALAKAMTARQTCPQCHAVLPYCIPISLGVCVGCAYAPDLAA